MKVERMVVIETNDIHVGDRIHVGKYTATCTSVTSKAALFLLDQYITGHGYLREAMQSEEVLNDFAGIRRYMVQFEDGDMLKIPFGYTWRNSEISRFRPIFLISMGKEYNMANNSIGERIAGLLREKCDCNHDCDALYEAYEKGKEDALKENHK